MGVAGRALQERGMVRDDVGVVAEHAHGGGADAMILSLEELLEQRQRKLVDAPGGPEAFELMALEVGVAGLERGKVAVQTGEDILRGVVAELQAAAGAGAILGQGQVGEELADGGAGDRGRRHQRAARVSHAVDATVGVVAHRVAGAVLHVADERVVPVREVERTIGGELHRDRAEITVLGLQEVLAEGQLEARALLRNRVLLGAEEADRVVDQDIALDVVGEVAAAHELEAGGRADHLGLGHEVGRERGELAEGHAERGRGHPAQVGVGSVREEILTVGVEGDAPRIGDAHAGGALELTALRGVAEEAAVRAAFDAVGGLHVAMEERTLGQVEGARGIGPEGADRVVRVVVVEAGQHDLGAVGLPVAVRVAQEDQVAALRHVDALGGELEGKRQVQAAGEDGLLVGLPVAVRVLEDQDLVVGLGVAGAPLRVAGHGRDPEPAAVVEGQTDRIGEIGELLLGGEELDLVAGGHGEGLQGLVTRQVVGRTVLGVAGGIVGLHRRQRGRLGVGGGDVELRALGGGPDGAVADQHQLVELL